MHFEEVLVLHVGKCKQFEAAFSDLLPSAPQEEVTLTVQQQQICAEPYLLLLLFQNRSKQEATVIAAGLLKEDLVDAFVVDQTIVSAETEVVSAKDVLEPDFLLVLEVPALAEGLGLDDPQGRHILDLALHLDGLENYFLSAVDLGETEEVLALDVGEPDNLAVPVELLLLFVG